MKKAESVRVAVVARGRVARGGLAAMLAETDQVKQTAVFRPEEFTTGAPEDTVQLLVLSCDVLMLWCVNGYGRGEDAWAAELAAAVRRNGVRVVLVLPGAEVRRIASCGPPPCDAVLDQDTLTTEVLDNVLCGLAGGEWLLPEPAALAAPPAPPGPAYPCRSRGWAAAPRNGSQPGLLTERERQVLELLVDGLSNRQIGQALGVSEHTAKRTVAIVLSKLNCPNRTQAVAVALREGLVGMGEALRP